MLNAYIIIGDAQTRKSSTIRALTGVSVSSLKQVHTSINTIDIFVNIQSLQESGKSSANFIASINGHGYKNVLFCLWASPHPNGLPDGCTYVNDFIRAGWTIQRIAVLGVSHWYCPSTITLPIAPIITNSRNMPANQIASQIRGIWQWL